MSSWPQMTSCGVGGLAVACGSRGCGPEPIQDVGRYEPKLTTVLRECVSVGHRECEPSHPCAFYQGRGMSPGHAAAGFQAERHSFVGGFTLPDQEGAGRVRTVCEFAGRQGLLPSVPRPGAGSRAHTGSPAPDWQLVLCETGK